MNRATKYRTTTNRPNRVDHQGCVTLHIVDIDNLIGDPTVTDPALIREARRIYEEVTGFRPEPHSRAVLGTGCNAKHAFAMQREWSFARTVRRPGENGADLALLEAIHEEVSTGRIGRIYLGTGDGLFTDSARWLLDRGHEVTVVSRASALSWKLRQAVHGNVLYLPDLSRGV